MIRTIMQPKNRPSKKDADENLDSRTALSMQQFFLSQIRLIFLIKYIVINAFKVHLCKKTLAQQSSYSDIRIQIKLHSEWRYEQNSLSSLFTSFHCIAYDISLITLQHYKQYVKLISEVHSNVWNNHIGRVMFTLPNWIHQIDNEMFKSSGNSTWQHNVIDIEYIPQTRLRTLLSDLVIVSTSLSIFMIKTVARTPFFISVDEWRFDGPMTRFRVYMLS